MPRGGHNAKGTGTVESTRSIDVMRLRRACFLVSARRAGWRWSYPDGSSANIDIEDGRDAIVLRYRIKSHSEDWKSVEQRVPIRWEQCRFGGERPWFVCDVAANGVYCGRRVTKLYGAGRLFACRHCYQLGYVAQRGDRMDRSHHRLARLHRKLGADYDGPDLPPPPKPKWMRWRMYERIAGQIEAAQEHLDMVFTLGAQRLVARIDKQDQRLRTRR